MKPSKTVTSVAVIDEYIVFTLKPPDLSPGLPWNRETIQELRTACDEYDDFKSMFLDGLERLKHHRGNYDEEGPNPRHLQLLWWWEFPRERWNELREGCSMNFLSKPIPLIQPNSVMTDEQLNISEDFIMEELVLLGVLIEVDSVYLKTNAPTFCLPKPDQPGQWRMLINTKKGRQNEAMGADPTVFPKTLPILDQLYWRGYTVVINALKYFYNFPTVPTERCYLGVMSTKTNKAYAYAGLALGGHQNLPVHCRTHGSRPPTKVGRHISLLSRRGDSEHMVASLCAPPTV
jgi:hypothetical protein